MALSWGRKRRNLVSGVRRLLKYASQITRALTSHRLHPGCYKGAEPPWRGSCRPATCVSPLRRATRLSGASGASARSQAPRRSASDRLSVRAVRRHRPEGTADEFGRGGLQKPLWPCNGPEAGKTPCDLFAFPREGQAKEAARVDSGREDNKSARTIPARA